MVGHDHQELVGVAILDLPDVDSVRVEHRATVDALLPRIDAVAWVVDPEKYDDERLHEYLRAAGGPRRPDAFIFNKADLSIRRSNRCWPTTSVAGWPPLESAGPIHMVSAAEGSGIDDLRSELSQAADGKAIMAAKLATDA